MAVRRPTLAGTGRCYNRLNRLPGADILKVKLRLFASYREKVGRSELAMDFPDGATVGDLAAEVGRRYRALTQTPGRLVVAVNHEYRDHDFALSDGDEIALIPPVSGGCARRALDASLSLRTFIRARRRL